MDGPRFIQSSRGDSRDSRADISAAGRAFGFKPRVRLEEGVKDYIAWIKELTCAAKS